MAANQFSTSQPRSSPAGRRHFTLEQANRALPLVSRIVRDIVNTHELATQLQGKMEEASGKDFTGIRQQLDSAVDKLQDYVTELETIGVELKDYETGLIDFPGRHQGRDVYLCWKLGEEKIGYWHELHTGFAGRQPTSKLVETD